MTFNKQMQKTFPICIRQFARVSGVDTRELSLCAPLFLCCFSFGEVEGERFGHVALRLLGISAEPVRLARQMSVRLLA